MSFPSLPRLALALRRTALGLGLAGLSGLARAAAPAVELAAPAIFSPGVVSGAADDGSPTFTPEEDLLLFSRSAPGWTVILESHPEAGGWSEPAIAPFSGRWSDLQPAFSVDGSYLVFSSWRPVDGEPAGKAAAPASHLWRVSHSYTGWGHPELLPGTANLSPRVFKPTLAANGDLYFMALVADAKFRLYCARNTGGALAPAEPLAFSDGTTGDVDPEVAPDGSFLVFSSNGRRAGDPDHEHLYVTFRTAAGWGPVLPVTFAGDDPRNPANENEAHLSRDLRTLYFSSDRVKPAHLPRSLAQARRDLADLEAWNNGSANVWTTPLAPLLARRPSPAS
jgi:hypothetical protein